MKNWLQKWTSKATAPEKIPDIMFGRYSDAYRLEDNLRAWEAAMQAYESGNYLLAYRHFFQFLRDEKEDNVLVEEKNGVLYFELIQGSKSVRGQANRHKLTAVAKICKITRLQAGYTRRMLEKNFSLKYCRYALDDDDVICMVFNTYNADGAPYKLYQALRELAINADKQDDLLLDEFKDSLQIVEQLPQQQMSAHEQMVKYEFTINSIRHVLNLAEEGKLPPEQFPGACSYLLLSLAYKLDFLVKPEGFMMETLERIHRTYFEKNDIINVQKNKLLCNEYKKLLARSKEDYLKEFYSTKATFGITSPENHNRVAVFIETEVHNMDWYQEHGRAEVALAIADYIVGFCLFNFAILKPDRDFFQLYYQITVPHFFEPLGFRPIFYDLSTNSFNKQAIRQAIQDIRSTHLNQYPQLQPDVRSLQFDDLASFAKSFLLMVKALDLAVVTK